MVNNGVLGKSGNMPDFHKTKTTLNRIGNELKYFIKGVNDFLKELTAHKDRDYSLLKGT